VNEQDLRKLLAAGSDATRAANPHLAAGLPAAEPEPCAVPALAVREETQGPRARRRHVRITAYRTRLLDPDNAVVKFIIDGLRECNVIRDDTSQDITLEVRQEKVRGKDKEGTLIEVI
jgi:hypothetical protein